MDLPAIDYLRQVQREERLADKVASQLRQAVVSGRLRPGERLPPERALGERFGVSRTVIREAMRGLAAMGLVEVRSGSGTVVARVGAAAVVETVQLFLQGAAMDHVHLHEVRAMLEVHVAGVAAERAGEEDLLELRGILDAMAAAGRDQHVPFHRGLARATHNPLYVVLLDAIGGPPRGPDEWPSTVQQAHEWVLERIAARDPEGAREAMRIHLLDVRSLWEPLVAAELDTGEQ